MSDAQPIRDPSSKSKYGWWRHRKGGLYEIIGFGIDENTMKPVVIYHGCRDIGSVWTRPCTEFFDGRFVREE